MGDKVYSLIHDILQRSSQVTDANDSVNLETVVPSENYIDTQLSKNGKESRTVIIVTEEGIPTISLDTGLPVESSVVDDNSQEIVSADISQSDQCESEVEKKDTTNIFLQVTDSKIDIKHNKKKLNKKMAKRDPEVNLTLSFCDGTHMHTYSIQQNAVVMSNEACEQPANRFPASKRCCLKLGGTNVIIVPSKRVLKCKFCEKEFSKPHLLSSHRRNHCSMKPYKCGECNRTFTQKETLRRHKNLHNNVRPYKCNQCEEAFLYRTTLIIHKQKHEGKKRFVCDVCQKQFNRKCNLTLHQRLHTGERPYECHLCDEKFIASTDLKRHTVKKHASGDACKIVRCPVCDKYFASSQGLRQHYDQHLVGERMSLQETDNNMITASLVSSQEGETQTVYLVTSQEKNVV